MNKVLIIAEAGVNHNGSIAIARRLIDKASEAGVDAVKFQCFSADRLVTHNAQKADYQEASTTGNETQYQMLKKLELDNNKNLELMRYARRKNILFLSSPFDIESIRQLSKLGVEMIKVPSGEINNLPYLREVGKTNKPVILSSGMATLGEIETALSILKENGSSKISVLHCNTEYPTPPEDVNLRAMQTIKEAFKLEVGYSDHTSGIEVAVAAVALGASIIEKHFTLDKNMEGPDHRASLEPEQLGAMVKAIRNVEKALGNGIKIPSPSEIKNRDIVRKSIVAARNIKKGECFCGNNLTVKRPGGGISPLRWDEFIGRTADRDYLKDEMIEI